MCRSKRWQWYSASTKLTLSGFCGSEQQAPASQALLPSITLPLSSCLVSPSLPGPQHSGSSLPAVKCIESITEEITWRFLLFSDFFCFLPVPVVLASCQSPLSKKTETAPGQKQWLPPLTVKSPTSAYVTNSGCLQQ